jgi:hypothetical protein
VGSNATLSVVARGADTLSFQWRKDGMDLTENDHFKGANQSQLRVESAGAAQAGSYSVRVANVVGATTSSEARLRVLISPALLQPVSQADGTTLLSIVNSDGSPLTDLQAYRYWIQTRTNLTEEAWTYVDLPMDLVEGELVMEDPASLLLPQRFFRTVQLEDPPATLRLRPPHRLPEGGIRLSAEPQGSSRPLTPAEATLVRVEAKDDLTSPEGWIQLPGMAELVGGLLVLEDPEAPSHAGRFYRARMDHAPEVRLRGEIRESDGVFLLRLGRQDGVPLSASDVFNYQVMVSSNPLESTDWTVLSGPMQLTNGALHLIDHDTNTAPRFYRVYAR